jgi:hypothetical protein
MPNQTIAAYTWYTPKSYSAPFENFKEKILGSFPNKTLSIREEYLA